MTIIDEMKRSRKFSGDFLLNLFASAIITGIMQILVYPYLAKRLLSYDYGRIVTSIGMINTIAASLGTSLNNTRLITNNEYIEKEYKGDFSILILCAGIISSSIIGLVAFFYFHYSLTVSIFLLLISFFMVVRYYLVVEYRIVLNFKKILLCSVVGAAGYIGGLFFFAFNNSFWYTTFFCSELLSLIYVIGSTSIWKETFRISPLFKTTFSKYLIIIVSVSTGTVMTYFDRFFLYPTVGAEAVATYSVSSFLGKAISILMIPMSSVLLSYFSQKNFRFTIDLFRKINVCIIGIATMFYFLTIAFAPQITGILYPTLIGTASEYIPIANAAAIISIACNMIQPAVLKFSPTYFQLVKEIPFAIVYFVLGYFLSNDFGLMGFCWSALISNLFKYILLCVIGELTFG